MRSVREELRNNYGTSVFHISDSVRSTIWTRTWSPVRANVGDSLNQGTYSKVYWTMWSAAR